MSRTSQISPRSSKLGLGLSLLFVAAIALPTGIRYWLDQHHFELGSRAYATADCETAIEAFDAIIQARRVNDLDDFVARAQAKKEACREFQTGVEHQHAGNLEAALVKYARFGDRYPISPLLKPIRRQVRGLLEQPGAAALAKPAVCQQLGSLVNQQMIFDPDANLPVLYANCAQAFVASQNYVQAIAFYEQFLERFPQHDLANSIKRAYAKTVVQETRAQGAKTILQPGRSGMTSDGSTVVVIENDSPETLRLVFSGANPRFAELPPCANCLTYSGTKPDDCDANDGAVGTYTLAPGNYEVVVKAIGDHAVRPFTGNWALNASTEYHSCFAIVENAALLRPRQPDAADE